MFHRMTIAKVVTVFLGLLVAVGYIWPSGFTIVENLVSGFAWDTNMTEPDALSFAVLAVYLIKRLGLVLFVCSLGIWLYLKKRNQTQK